MTPGTYQERAEQFRDILSMGQDPQVCVITGWNPETAQYQDSLSEEQLIANAREQRDDLKQIVDNLFPED
jgi:hypothetical protein